MKDIHSGNATHLSFVIEFAGTDYSLVTALDIDSSTALIYLVEGVATEKVISDLEGTQPSGWMNIVLWACLCQKLFDVGAATPLIMSEQIVIPTAEL